MRRALFALASITSLGLAAPTLTLLGWSSQLAEFYSLVDKHAQLARDLPDFPNPPSCDLTQASQPVAPTPLPSPDPSLVLKEVVIGRGVQNYTCSSNAPSTTPASIGAVASLYNASCIAANYPDILSVLPTLALQIPFPISEDQNFPPANLDLSGQHYFITNTTPVFNLNASPNPAQDLGVVVGHKVANSSAPADATKGPDDVGYGAVPWLFLNTTTATIGDIREIYRLNTAGGSPPPTCENMPPSFSIQYAAEYWFYGLPYGPNNEKDC